MGTLTAVGLHQVSSLVLGLVSIRLISEFVPPATYGLYVLFLTLTQLAPLLVHSPEINHAARFWQREQTSRSVYTKFLWDALWRKGAYLVPLLGVCCVGLAYYQGNAVWLWIWPSLWLGNLAGSAAMMAQNGLNADGRRWTVLWIGLVGNAGRIVLPVAFVLIAGASLSSLAMGYAVHAVIGLGIVGLLLGWRGKSHETAEQRSNWTGELRSYGQPFVLMGIGAWLLQCFDRWAVGLMFGEHTAGLFGLAAGIAGAIPLLVFGGFLQLVFPAIFRGADLARTREDWQALARRCDLASVCSLLAAAAGVLLLRFLAPYLVGWLISPKYQAALAFIVPAGFSALTAAALQFHYLLLQGQAKSGAMVKVMATVATLKVGVCLASAFFSLSAFLIALMIMLPVSFVVGRTLICRLALGTKTTESAKDLRTVPGTF